MFYNNCEDATEKSKKLQNAFFFLSKATDEGRTGEARCGELQKFEATTLITTRKFYIAPKNDK